MASLKIFRAALWREERVQRDTVLKLLAAIPVLVAAVTYALLYTGQQQRDTVEPAMLCTLLLAFAGLCPGLFAQEFEQGSARFLARTPRALHGALWSKLVALFVLPFALALFGGCCAYVLRATFWTSSQVSLRLTWTASLAAIAFVVALWSLPCGLLLRTSLVLPATLLAGAVILALPLLCFDSPPAWQLEISWIAIGGCAMASSWLALMFGRRRGHALVRTAGLALAPFLLLISGLLAGTASNGSVTPRSRVPRLERSYIDTAILSADGRTVYLSWIPKDAPRFRALTIDLDSETVLRDEKGVRFSNLGIFDVTSFLSGHFGKHALIVRTQDETHEILDLRNGKVLGWRARGASPLEDPELDEWMRIAKRATTPWRNGKGRSLWLQAGRWEFETATGEIEAISLPSKSRGFCMGHRLWIDNSGNGQSAGWDPLRGCVVTARDKQSQFVGCIPEGWLFIKNSALELIDPDTQERLQSTPLAKSASVALVVREGFALIHTFDDDRRTESLDLLDPATGEARKITARGVELEQVRGLRYAGHFSTEARDRSQRLLVQVPTADAELLGRLDIERGELEVLRCIRSPRDEAPITAVAMLDEDEVLAIVGHRQLVRASFATDTARVIYEVPQP